MDNSQDALFAIEVGVLRVGTVRGWRVASLRFFDPAGRFAAVVRETIGQPVPEPLRAAALHSASHDARAILAWRSPTETLLLCNDRAAFAELEQRLLAAVDGCMVDQTGGLCVLRVQGQRAGDLLQRMGATTAIPALGEARGCRLAEVHVLTACVQTEEILLVVERVYADHLIEWIRATVADFN